MQGLVWRPTRVSVALAKSIVFIQLSVAAVLPSGVFLVVPTGWATRQDIHAHIYVYIHIHTYIYISL